jgi:hypothetical protein
MPSRNINLTDLFDRERQAKLKTLRQAAKQGFDEIDRGHGVALKGKKALDKFLEGIVREVLVKDSK